MAQKRTCVRQIFFKKVSIAFTRVECLENTELVVCIYSTSNMLQIEMKCADFWAQLQDLKQVGLKVLTCGMLRIEPDCIEVDHIDLFTKYLNVHNIINLESKNT